MSTIEFVLLTEKDRETETERQRDREKQRDRETKRQRDRDRDRDRDRELLLNRANLHYSMVFKSFKTFSHLLLLVNV